MRFLPGDGLTGDPGVMAKGVQILIDGIVDVASEISALGWGDWQSREMTEE